MRNMSVNGYAILPSFESDGDEKATYTAGSHKIRQPWRTSTAVLAILLCISLSLNLTSVVRPHLDPNLSSMPSKYAGLYRDLPTQIIKHSDYDSPNRTIENAAWDNPELLPENGFVALDDSWTEQKGLPTAQRWPWDKNKGVYILTSSHELHCVRILRESVNQAHDGLPQYWRHLHVLHCLNVLRESVMCNADDTPLYTGRLHDETHTAEPKAGIGSIKMCRDWSKLQTFAREHSACWSRARIKDPAFPEIERFKHCPDGATPWEGQPARGTYDEGRRE